MDIVLYLTALLRSRKMVGIAGLGTLYKKKSPGKYDAEKHAFIPPSYTLSFTTELKESEELAIYISEDRNISVDSAKYFISEFTDQILAQLADHQQATLVGIGTLKVENNDLILIESEESGVTNETYGLPIVDDLNPSSTSSDGKIAEIEDEKLAEIEEENRIEEENPGSESQGTSFETEADEQFVYDEIAEVNTAERTWEINNKTAPIIETAEQEDKTEEPVIIPPQPPIVPAETVIEEVEETPKQGMSILVKVLIVLAIILLAGAIAYFINPSFFDKYIQNNHQENHKASVPVPPNDSLKKQVDSVKTLDSLPTAQVPVTTTNASGIDSTKIYYEVIGTSYKTKAAAEGYIKTLGKKGINATIAAMGGKRFNVSLGTFSKAEPAYKLRDSLRKSLKNKEIYIQPIHPKTHTK